jgi:uncharacterized membrane-anchored protein YjiN (DUF445 family)
MAEKAQEAQVAESKETKVAETVAKPEEGKTVGEVLETKAPEPKEAKMVPEAVLLEFKKENKEMAKELKSLKEAIEGGASKKEVSSDLKALAEKHGQDPEFLKEFADSVRKEAEANAEKILKPLQDQDTAAKKDKVFNENFDKTLEEYPEYKNLANKEVIRTLALDPKNSNKTFAQIFQDSYGHLVTGKKTLDTTVAGGGKEAPQIDYGKAASDPKYFKEIMADPELKKEYNKTLTIRNRF